MESSKKQRRRKKQPKPKEPSPQEDKKEVEEGEELVAQLVEDEDTVKDLLHHLQISKMGEEPLAFSPFSEGTASSTTTPQSRMDSSPDSGGSAQGASWRRRVAVLEAQLREKEALLTASRRDREHGRLRWQEKLAESLQEQQRVENKAQKDAKQFREKFTILHEETAQRLKELQKAQEELQRRDPLLREGAKAFQQAMMAPVVSEYEYHEIAVLSEEERSLRQHVVFRIYEVVSEHIKAKEKAQKRANALSEELEETKAALEHERKVRALDNKTHNETQALLQADVASMEQRCGRMNEELTQRIALVDELSAKGARYDAVEHERATLEGQGKRLQAENESVRYELERSKGELERLRSSVLDANHQMDLLHVEHEQQGKHVVVLRERCDTLEADNIRKSAMVTELTQAREDLHAQLAKTMETSRHTVEDALRGEVERIRQDNAQELDALRVEAKRAGDREVAVLREAKDRAEAEAARSGKALEDVRRERDDLAVKLRSRTDAGDTRVAELEARLRVANFEVERLGAVHEEMSATLERLRDENNALHRKVEAVTEEYHKIKSATSASQAQIEAANAVLRDRLAGYEEMEAGIDEQVLRAAEDEIKAAQEDKRATNAASEAVLVALGPKVPTTAKRRLKQVGVEETNKQKIQSVALAKQIMTLEREAVMLKKERDDAILATRKTAEELQRTHALLGMTRQPYNFLVEELRKQEAKAAEAKEHETLIKSELEGLRQEREHLLEERSRLSNDLDVLLQQRQSMWVDIEKRPNNAGVDDVQRKLGELEASIQGPSVHQRTRRPQRRPPKQKHEPSRDLSVSAAPNEGIGTEPEPLWVESVRT